MFRAAILGAAALIAGVLGAPQATQAQTTIDSLGVTVTATPALASDYIFRGISQTRGGPAMQFTLDVEHSSGFYIGGFISNVAWPPGTPPVDIRQETDLNLGYRFSLGDVKLDVGATYFGYPGYTRPTGAFDWAWYELTLRASYEIQNVKLVGTFAYSPNFNFQTGNAFYVEGGADLTLDFGITAAARIGYQWVEDNRRWGAPDYAVFSFGLSREIAFGVIGGVTGYYTSLNRRDCFSGLDICGMRAVASLTRPF
jgi:uncharacterized protein (TIGR02001 family)